MNVGIELIYVERMEQLNKHNRTVEKDLERNKNGELLMAVDALIQHKYGMMPDNWDEAVVNKMMEKSFIDRLAIAGAFIAAEIDRLNTIKFLSE